MKTDLVLAPFDSAIGDMLAAARAADAGGFDTVWTYDHFSGLVVNGHWSRDPFVTLGAMAASTERIGLGILVANAANRHPAQLACAVNSLQSLAPGRVRLGVGAGAAPRSPWSAERVVIGGSVPDAATRRAILVETIGALRALWAADAFTGEHLRVSAAMAVTDGSAMPPVVVGASSAATIELARAHADGVNLLPGDDLPQRVATARGARGADFEISVLAPLDPNHELGGDPTGLTDLGVGRRTLYVRAPFDVERIAAIGRALKRAD